MIEYWSKLVFIKTTEQQNSVHPIYLSAQYGFSTVYSNGFLFKKPWKYILLSTHAYKFSDINTSCKIEVMMMMNCFCGMVGRPNTFSLIFSQDHRQRTIANLQHAAIRIWTCAERKFRLCWMMLCSSDSHYW